ncbi:protein muscleblind isoform X18 [Stomoxys calcitrans]|uniref:protein muscleblind isoform X18 n=1 Tax=Stomoxys calcitrans TaxID=35570 RepID=UPI0027E32DC9|nr:protein muscleblind isoform X18 [Stomoxys calcitrans]
MAAMVNMTSLLNGKDSRWLQLEVCREFQRNKCSRQDTECKFAHPPANVEVQNGKVTACYDSIKGRCNRDKPPCKYFHPPQHLKDQLLINGRNHLALKNALMQQMGIAPGQPVIPGQVPAVATNPYLTGIPANTYSPYFAPGHLVPALLGPDPSAVASQLGPVVPQAVQVAQQKIPRSDRLEVCREFVRGACKRAESECRFAHPQDTVARHDDGSITVCMDAVKAAATTPSATTTATNKYGQCSSSCCCSQCCSCRGHVLRPTTSPRSGQETCRRYRHVSIGLFWHGTHQTSCC